MEKINEIDIFFMPHGGEELLGLCDCSDEKGDGIMDPNYGNQLLGEPSGITTDSVLTGATVEEISREFLDILNCVDKK